MTDPIIRVEGLGKRYRIWHQAERQRYTALRDVIAEKAKKLFSRRQRSEIRDQTSDLRCPTPARASQEDFWALKDVSFEVKQGEVMGIIGRNGAGKSTMLKILSRITEPTEGRVRIKGRVASLLEVGTGFHPELTGRENVFLNGAILGMRRLEIKSKFDEIVTFAEVEQFLDTPVKRYSSGMYVRLAFAVAAHLEPEILIVDEVLAVGDAQFQKKCLGKMQNVAKGGRTVLFVSHNMAAVQALCGCAIHLQGGAIKATGEVELIVNQYIAATSLGENRPLRGPVRIGDSLRLLRLEFNPNPAVSCAPLRFLIEFHTEHAMIISEVQVLFYSAQGVRVAIIDFRACGLPANLEAGHHWRGEGEISSLPFVEGDYQAGLYVKAGNFQGDLLDLASIAIRVRNTNGHVPAPARYRGLIELNFTAQFQASASACCA
jgi:lipopolysaccharide transport system ATP-binding protein